MPTKRAKKKYDKDKDRILLLVKAKGIYYAAALAWKIPSAYTDDLDDYKPKKGDPVIASDRAFVIRLEDIEALEKKLGGVLEPPGPPK